jgi:hypothetical protein
MSMLVIHVALGVFAPFVKAGCSKANGNRQHAADVT